MPLAGHRHPVHHPTAQASEPSRPRAGGGPLGGAGVTPDLADYLAEEFVESDEEEEMPKEAQSALGQGLGKKKSSQWERVDVEDPLKRTDSIFDKTFYHKVYSMNSTTPAKEISSGEDDDGSDEEEAHEVDDELDLDDNWNEEEEMWFDLHPPKHNMIKYQHEVRSVPSLDGKVIGFLIPGAGAGQTTQECEEGRRLNAAGGLNWLFCRFHKVSRESPPSKPVQGAPKGAHAWSGLGLDQREGPTPSLGHVYLAKAAGVDEEDCPSPLPSPTRINNFKKRAGVSFAIIRLKARKRGLETF